MANPQPTPISTDPGTYDLSKPEDVERFRRDAAQPQSREAVSPFESFWRGAAEGATFGFDDELGLDASRREESRKQNPWTHFAGEMVGGIAPVVATGGIGAGLRAGAVAARAARIVPTSAVRAATATARGIESAMLPGQITNVGSAALQGAKQGAVYGGLSGAGHAETIEEDSLPDALGKRLSGAVKGAGVGTVAGAALGTAAHGVGRAAQGVLSARAAARSETENAPAGALQALSRSFERDRITPDDIVANIRAEFPRDTASAGGLGNRWWGASNARQPWTADMVEDVVRRAINGEGADDISAALRAAGNGRGPGAASVRTLLNELADRHLGPLNLVDRASMIRTGAGANTQMTLRAAAATPGEHLSIARENLLERQIGAHGRLSAAFDRLIGSGDYDGVAQRHADDLRAAGDVAYRAATSAERPFNLMPIFDRWRQRYQTQRGPLPDGVRTAIDDMHTTASGPLAGPSGTLWPPQTLEGFINARQGLSSAIETAIGQNNRTLAAQLTQLRNELSDEVRRTNPLWGVANDIWRDGRAAEDALEAGTRMATRLNTRTREALEEFVTGRDMVRRGSSQANPDPAMVQAGQARMDLFRVGLVRSLNDMLSNAGETHNLTRTLRLPSARQIMNEVLGPDDAARLYRIIDAEHAQHRTYSSQFGSQTTPLREAIDDLNWAPRFRSAWELLNPRIALAEAGDRLAAVMSANRNRAMVPLMTDTNPINQLNTMRAVQQVARARDVGDQTVRRPLITAAGPTSNVAAGEALPKPTPTSRLLSQARNALRRGADRSSVEDRLRALGVDPRDL